MALGIVDIVLLTLSVVASAAIGVYYGVKGLRSTPLEYMLGGRNMKPLPLAMSMMVGTVSAITIMGNAGEMYAYGTQLWLMDLGIVLGLVIVANVFIPIMYPLNMVSLYEVSYLYRLCACLYVCICTDSLGQIPILNTITNM